MNPEVRVHIADKRLDYFTMLRLVRSASELTGTLFLDIFGARLPDGRFLAEASPSEQVTVHFGNKLVFRGLIDARQDETSGVSVRIDAQSYDMSLSCRGLNGLMVDTVHVHPEGTLLRTTARTIAGEILRPFGAIIEWLGDSVPVPLWRLLDGGTVAQELARIANYAGVRIFEKPDGSLVATDKPLPGVRGEAFVLGRNIMKATIRLRADKTRGVFVVQGADMSRGVWGRRSAIEGTRGFEVPGAGRATGERIQGLGPATPEALKRRAENERSYRSGMSSGINIDIFGIVQSNGQPYQIGATHRVVFPPAGVDGEYVIERLMHTISKEQYFTTLELVPPEAFSRAGGGKADGTGTTAGTTGPVVDKGAEEWRQLVDRLKRALRGTEIPPR